MRWIFRLCGRFPFVAGLLAGVVAAGGATAALAVAGVVTTEALYVDLGPRVRVWDTHRRADPASWELVTRAGHRFASADHVYVETAHVRLAHDRGSGLALAPLTTAPRAVAAKDTGRPAAPAAVAELSDAEAVLELPEGTARVRADWHGYVIRATASRLPLKRFAGPWVAHSPAGSVAAAGVPAATRRLPLPPAGVRTLTTARGPAVAVVTAQPATLTVEADGGAWRLATVEAQEMGPLQVYVGLADTGVLDGGARLVEGGTVRVTPWRAGLFVETVAGPWGRRDRRVQLGAGPQDRGAPDGTAVAGYRPLDGDGAMEPLRAEGLAGFAAAG